MKETFENYLERLKKRRSEDGYKYTDADFEKYKEYIYFSPQLVSSKSAFLTQFFSPSELSSAVIKSTQP